MHAFSFSFAPLRLLYSYLINRNHKTRMILPVMPMTPYLLPHIILLIETADRRLKKKVYFENINLKNINDNKSSERQ